MFCRVLTLRPQFDEVHAAISLMSMKADRWCSSGGIHFPPLDATFMNETFTSAEPPPPSPRKVRSSLQTAPHCMTSPATPSPRRPKIRLTRKSKVDTHQQRLNQWHKHLDAFLQSEQESLPSSRSGTILTTLAVGGEAVVTTSKVKASSKAASTTSTRNRSAAHSNTISTHRFVLPIDIEAREWHSLSQSSSKTISDDEIANYGCYYISCVCWESQLWITKWVMAPVVGGRANRKLNCPLSLSPSLSSLLHLQLRHLPHCKSECCAGFALHETVLTGSHVFVTSVPHGGHRLPSRRSGEAV